MSLSLLYLKPLWLAGQRSNNIVLPTTLTSAQTPHDPFHDHAGMMNLYEAGAYAAAGDMVVKLQVSENLSPLAHTNASNCTNT